MNPDTIDGAVLAACQRQARSGLYATALSGYVQWLARRYDRIARLRHHWLARLRQIGAATDHPRTPEVLANLLIGLHLALHYGRAVGALSPREARDCFHEGCNALRKVGSQPTYLREAARPADHFLDLLRRALVSGSAHVASSDGAVPSAPQDWGWRRHPKPEGASQEPEWRPRGVRLGWLDRDDLYLDLDACARAARESGRRIGAPLTLTPRAMGKRLREQNLLVTVDPARESLTVRRVLEGARRNVLHLRAETLTLRLARDQPDHTPDQAVPGVSPGENTSLPRAKTRGGHGSVGEVAVPTTTSDVRTSGISLSRDHSAEPRPDDRVGRGTAAETGVSQLNLSLDL